MHIQETIVYGPLVAGLGSLLNMGILTRALLAVVLMGEEEAGQQCMHFIFNRKQGYDSI